MQREFESRLGQRIEELSNVHNSRSEKLGISLQCVQTDMQDLAGQLQEIAASIQRLEVKLDRIYDGGGGNFKTNQQWPQNCDGSEKRDENLLSLKRKLNANVLVDNLTDLGSEAAQSLVTDDDVDEDIRRMPKSQPEAADMQKQKVLDLEAKFGVIDKRLERISASMKIKSDANDGDDDEDRRRLKERLKDAIEVDRRSRIHTIISKKEMWLEYIFGLCSPDQRIGKRGSRCRQFRLI